MLRVGSKGNLPWLGIPLAVALLAGCGEDAAQSGNNMGGAATLSGSVFASYVNGANCNVLDTNGNVIAGPFTTSGRGGYRISLPDSHLAENLVVECNGGTFIDEATGNIQTAGTMKAYIAGGTASVGTSVHVTPSTTIITALVEHGMTAADAFAAFVAAFGFSPDYAVAPTDATNPEVGASEARLLAGLRAAIFSQLAKDLSIEQFDLIAALAADLAADGELNGNTILPVDIQNRFNEALVNFRDGNDATGLASSELGVLPFAKTVLTENYRMTYVEGMHKAINGKTAFSIKVTNHDGDTSVTGLAVSIDPLMNMNGRQHKTAYDASCNEMAAGEYHCTVYYLMPSVMGMGEMAMSMGYWALTVTADDGSAVEEAIFYPTVTMAMGDSAQVRLKAKNGDMDTVMAMGEGSEGRTYYLFKQGLTGAEGVYDLDLFIAAKESMMSFPAIATGITLNAGSEMHALTLGSIGVALSTDGEGWSPLVEGAAGHWGINGLALADNELATLYIRLTVNDMQKSADGAALNNVPLESVDPVNNHYAVFKLTPAGSMMHEAM